MIKDANTVFQIEFAEDVTIGVTGYLVLVQDAVEAVIKDFKALENQKLNPVVLPQSDGQPADFPLFMLTSELISVQATKKILTINLNYAASAIDTAVIVKFMTALVKEFRKRLGEKITNNHYARFDASFYRFLQLKDDAKKTERVNAFLAKVINLEAETEPVDAIQGFQSAYITKHSNEVSKKIFYAFAVNHELKTHAIQLGVGAISGNVGGSDILTFEKMTLGDRHVDAFVEYIENSIAEVIDERVKSVSKCIQ